MQTMAYKVRDFLYSSRSTINRPLIRSTGAPQSAAMSNNRDKRNRRSSVNERGGPRYPGEWTEWEWNPERQKWRREREVARNEIEVVHRDDPQRTPRPTPAALSVPRNDPVPSFSTIPQSTSLYTKEDGYTYQSGSAFPLSESLAGLSMASAPPPPLNSIPKPEVHVMTIDSSTNEERLDPNYKVEPAWKFGFGKVFKVLWSEPGGFIKGARGGTVYSEKIGLYGESVLQKVRRFVVIDKMKGHCICLPIMTYQGQGTGKRGVHPDDHAIIYTNKPELVRDENALNKDPIKMTPFSPQHKLEPASRLNYAKVYTIEYNVKVYFIGKIAEESEWKLVAAYNDVHPPLRPRGAQRGLSLADSSGDYLTPSDPRDPSPGFPPWTSRTSGVPATSLGFSQMPLPAPAPTQFQYNVAPIPRSRRNDGFSDPRGFDYQRQLPRQDQEFPPNVSVTRHNPVETSNYQYHQSTRYVEPQHPYPPPPAAGHYATSGSYPAQSQYVTQQSQYLFQGNAGPSYQNDYYGDALPSDNYGRGPPRRDDNNDLYDA